MNMKDRFQLADLLRQAGDKVVIGDSAELVLNFDWDVPSDSYNITIRPSSWRTDEALGRPQPETSASGHERIHAAFVYADRQIMRILHACEGLSIDTVLAIGETLGQIHKAKALIGRDIDDARQKGEGP